MKQGRQRAVLERIVQRVVDWLLRYVTWHTSESRNLSRRQGDYFPVVCILGREHYSERSKSYPALRRRDLEKVLRQELAGEPPTLTLLGPIVGDRREVRFYRLDRAVIDSLPRSLFIVPESVLLGTQLPADSWADVRRQDYRYFLFANGPSQPAGGALGERELVAMAAGIDLDSVPEEWHESDELLGRLRRALPALHAWSWWSCRNPMPRRFSFAGVEWKQIALTAAVMLFAYLTLSSIYLQAFLSQRQAALDALGPDIQAALVADNEARVFASRTNALIELWSGRSDTQRLWEAVAAALHNQGSIDALWMPRRY